MKNGTELAAIDLGSNSFRLEIAQIDHGLLKRREYLKETVRQGNGLDEDRNLTHEAMQRGWECLGRFAERLAGFRKGQVRAVATQTLREARNRDVFLERAQSILGFPIEVVSGREEARLIYQGVTHLLPQSNERRLVVDIGGRSTEIILGQGYRPGFMDSYRVGSVAWSMRYFPQGRFTAAAFETAEVAAQAVLDEALVSCRREDWDVVYGSSGTVGAVGDVLQGAGWPAGRVTREGLDWLLVQLLRTGSADRLRLDGMKDDRRAVIGGGVSVLRGVFQLLGIEEMHVAQGALRHGALYDLLDREHEQTDQRSTSVQRLARNFGVDPAQARRVSQVAEALLLQLAASHNLPELDRHLRKLGWAAQLHEIGSAISHSDYHKHGAYILDNADAAGFTMNELHRLGQLVLGHRGKLRKLDLRLDDAAFTLQLMALRLAVILCHARRDPELERVQIQWDGGTEVQLLHPAAWAARYPQSAWLLQEETMAWQKTAWALSVNTAG
ncbi:MAG: Ppx/GppA family phosphatase [Curvibacter sp.]|jgi:exopolyphosphatase/guanosine-5'-triphosphate,3'-diphosphate pyrophosphatase|nr:Ppx/GppA family phosphatase [Curvibacter sp.]